MQEKFTKVSASFNSAFNGGTSVLEKGDSGTSTDGVPSIVSELTNSQMEEATMNGVKSQIEHDINSAGYSDKVEVSVNKAGLDVNIKDVILFDSAKADVKNASNPLLIQISQALKGLDNNIKIIGHTDNRPISNGEFRSNWDLSAMRAINIMQFMTQYGGLPADKLSIEAYGEYKAKYDNSTEEGQAENRRVEISILRKYPVEDNVNTGS